MSDNLKILAEKLNISLDFTFPCGGGVKHCQASDELLKFFINSMGYNANSDANIEKSIARLDKKRWQQVLEPIYVVNVNNICFDLVLNKNENIDDVEVFYVKEGAKKYIKADVCFSEVDRKVECRTTYVKYEGRFSDNLEPQYYDLKVVVKDKEYKSMLAVAPQRCFEIDKKGKEKLFGYALQLYSVKSKRNWGVGDFRDLADMVELLAQSGGDVIGLNPLNVLEHDYPESASPYNSISRLFLNPIYIDVESVPLYKKEDKNEDLIRQIKEKENIDYTLVYNAKIKALENIFARLKEEKKNEFYAQFEAFKKDEGIELHKLALFQAISHERIMLGGQVSKKWLKDYETPISAGIEKFGEEHKDEIEFFKFLQFVADKQLRDVKRKVDEKGLIVGLYRDLPVGVSRGSAEVWSDKYLYMQESGAGAPPDNYFPTGQKWGLGAFNPFELKERCYKPFIKILRANMRYAGALRIDHVMGLARLYIVPDKDEVGTYIRYNVEDMMNIVALESHLNKCMVVGECIGNVENGFNQLLLDRNIYMLGVLWSERQDDGISLKKPYEYEDKYFASVGTHDMPPLKAWWFGLEIAKMKELKLFNEEEARNAYYQRENERRNLLRCLDEEGVWPSDNYRKSDYIYGEGYPEGIEEAVHGYMAKTNSEVFIIQLEDVFKSQKLQNLPGTDVDKHPNWRKRLTVDLEDMKDNENYIRNMNIVKKWR